MLSSSAGSPWEHCCRDDLLTFSAYGYFQEGCPGVSMTMLRGIMGSGHSALLDQSPWH